MEQYQLNIVQTLGMMVILLVTRTVVSRIISKRLRIAEFSLQRKKITLKALNLLYTLFFIASLAGIWGLKGEQVLAFVTSILAVLGVGFFAQWSLLSNITSGIILYFNHPLKLGDQISIIDKDFPLKGTIIDISLFFLHVKDEEGVIFTLPNTVVIQKTITIVEKEKPADTEDHEKLIQD